MPKKKGRGSKRGKSQDDQERVKRDLIFNEFLPGKGRKNRKRRKKQDEETVKRDMNFKELRQGKGRKNRKQGKNQNEEKVKRDLNFKEHLQEYAQVKKVLGGCWVLAYCFDGKERRCHIPGRFRKKVWIRGGDIVLVSLREFQDGVADIIHKYYRGEARSLVALKEIPESVDLSFSGVCEFEDEEGNPRMDFDYFGYLRNPDDYRRIRSTGVLNMDDEDVDYYESLHQWGIEGPVI